MTKDEDEVWVRAMRTYLKRVTGTKGWAVPLMPKLLKAAVHELDLALPLSAEAAQARVAGVLSSMSQLFDCALRSDERPVNEGRRIRGIVAGGVRGGMPVVVTVDLRPAEAGGTAVWIRAAARELLASQQTAQKAALAVADRLAQHESNGPASTAGSWFEAEPGDEAEMSSAEAAFAAALRGHGSARVLAGVDGYVPGFGADGVTEPLVACADLTDLADPPHLLLRAGVHLVGNRVRGDRLHSQLYSLPERPSSWALDAHGTPGQLAESSAHWFQMVLGKPVVLYVWLHDDYAYAARYAFADTGETLTQCYNRSLAPAGQAEELIAAGHVHGRGWIQTTGLPVPTCYLHIRGDLAKGAVPPGVPALTKRGPIPGLWYEGSLECDSRIASQLRGYAAIGHSGGAE